MIDETIITTRTKKYDKVDTRMSLITIVKVRVKCKRIIIPFKIMYDI